MLQPISVLHFVRRIRAEDGGVVQTVLDLCQNVAQRGHHVTLATFDVTDVPKDWCEGKESVPQVVKLEPASWNRSRLSSASVRQFCLLARQAEVAHLHTPWEPVNVQLASLLRSARTPYVVTTHGMLDDWCMRQKSLKKRIYLALAGRRLFRQATAVHFTAEAEQDQAMQWIPGDYLPIVQACAIDLSPYDALPGPESAFIAFPELNPARKRLLFLSRIHPKKGIELLLRAGKLLRDRQWPVQLLIAGPGDDEYLGELQSLSRSLNLNGDTVFLGMVRGREKLSLYQSADVFVLPTYQENFGLVLPEAMACGTPVVTTRGTDIWRELEQAGAKIAANEPQSLADAIESFLSDDSLRHCAGQQGREYVMNWLSAENVSRGYEQMYRDTIARGAA